jgi:hypothetical protein
MSYKFQYVSERTEFYNTFRVIHKIYSTCILINSNVLIIYYLRLHQQTLNIETLNTP